MISLSEYAKKVEGLCIDYDGMYGHQCVDLVRHYSQNVLGFKLGIFGGSAMTGWKNIANTFSKTKFEKITDLSKLLPGDIVFTVGSSENNYGHVMILLKVFGNGKIQVLEQNMGDGNGRGADDFVKISIYDLNSKILGAYRYRENRIFTDVPDSHPFFKSIKWAKDNGIAHGYSDGRLGADEVLTVGRFLAFLENFDKKKN